MTSAPYRTFWRYRLGPTDCLRWLSRASLLVMLSGLVSSETHGQAISIAPRASQTPRSPIRIRTTVWMPDGDSLKLSRSVESFGGPNVGDSIWGTRMGSVSPVGIEAARALIEKDRVGAQLSALLAQRLQDSSARGRSTRFQPSDAHPFDYDPTTQRGGFWVTREMEDHVLVRTSVIEEKGNLKSISSTITKENEGVTRLIGSIARDYSDGRLRRLSVVEYDGGRVVQAR